MDEEDYVTPIHVRDYLFCPSIFYYKHVLGISEPITELMEEGLRDYAGDVERWEERKTLLSKKRVNVDRMLFNLSLASQRYRVKGVVDTVYWMNSRLHILEIKVSESEKLFPDHLYQAAVYALMVEEEFREPVYKIVIFYKKSGKWFEKRFTSQLRQYTVRLVEKIHKILEHGYVPEYRLTRKCTSCFYRRFCHGY